MKKISISFIRAIIIVSVLFSISSSVYAIQDYSVLTPLPGLQRADDTTDIQTYLPNAFRLTITIAAIMAFVMITFGGIMYATSDAISNRSQGREYVTNAIYGLLLVICAWVILNTINPKILDFSLDVDEIVTNTQFNNTSSPVACCSYNPDGTLKGYTLTAQEITLNNDMRTDLQNNYQVATNNGPCTNPAVTTGCTNLVGLPNNAYVGVTAFKDACDAAMKTSCNVMITGGTEGGHLTHGPNKPVMDLAPSPEVTNFILKTAADRKVVPVKTSLGNQYTFSINGRTTTYLQETDHWHVVFQ